MSADKPRLSRLILLVLTLQAASSALPETAADASPPSTAPNWPTHPHDGTQRLGELAREASLALTIAPHRDLAGNARTQVLIDASAAFHDRTDRLRPDYAHLLARVGVMLQRRPGAHLAVTGLNSTPRTGHNPVLFGRRLRAIQVHLAENGAAIDRIEARIQALSDRGATTEPHPGLSPGQTILLDFIWD